ncbi:hypothetical protein ACKUB1_01030 [Methanospirillum stamsii]|uniref:Uncharacterized protein n=1 Tax=Methanospirillum stamsii TaxID=1277351 RepID=A0A2V2N443_9EURY|nr:hypothetical protein [Methanospirillum stamsii]PWR74579.1 hypothetical protein DLD82_08320 [Methanospirillum stamsii]
MKYRKTLLFLMITVLLLCIISVSSVTALEPKISKSLIPMEKKNLSVNTHVIAKAVGTRLFDGTEIIQSPEVISTALKKMKSGVYLYEVDGEPVDMARSLPLQEPYWDWTLRQFADYLEANSSRTILYSLTRTNGDYTKTTRGVLGYNPSVDLIIGDKYDQYVLSCSVYPECNLDLWDFSQLRLMIDPDSNQLIIQEFYRFRSSLSPDEEETILIEPYYSRLWSPNGISNTFFGKSNHYQQIHVISLWPYPLPE